MHPALATRRFSSLEACRGANIESSTFKNWISRDPPAILLSSQDRDARDGRGSFSFSLNRVMQLALCAELVALGFAPRQAGMLAAGFTDVGEGSSVWVNDPEPEHEPKALRLPGDLFSDGYTVLVAHRGSDASEIKNVFPGQAWDPFYSMGGGHSTSAVLVNVNFVFWAVLRRLGYDRNGEPVSE